MTSSTLFSNQLKDDSIMRPRYYLRSSIVNSFSNKTLPPRMGLRLIYLRSHISFDLFLSIKISSICKLFCRITRIISRFSLPILTMKWHSNLRSLNIYSKRTYALAVSVYPTNDLKITIIPVINKLALIYVKKCLKIDVLEMTCKTSRDSH